MPRPHFLVFLLSCLLLVATGTHGQNPSVTPSSPVPVPSPTPAPLTNRLNVIVLDERGAPVADLRAEDFRVLEGGAPQTINTCTYAELPVSYALAVDNSGSMRPHLYLLKDTANAVIAGNRPGDETALIRFIDSEEIEVLVGFTSDGQSLTSALNSFYIGGGQSAIIDAVFLSARYAAEQHRGEARRRAVVLLADGEDRDSYYKLEELLKYLRATDVQVFVIGLVQALDKQSGLIRPSARMQAMKLLDTLAEETGGRVFYPKMTEELREAVAALWHDLHTQYVIEYIPTSQAQAGKQRKVQVKLVDKPGAGTRKVIVRPAYIVPTDTPPKDKEDKKSKRP